jgi:hypothetical protein
MARLSRSTELTVVGPGDCEFRVSRALRAVSALDRSRGHTFNNVPLTDEIEHDDRNN